MYHERGWLVRNPVLWAALTVAMVALGAASYHDPRARWVLLVPLVVLGLLFAANLRIDVDGERLRLTYFPLRRRTIPLATITAAEIVPYRWLRYGGWGLRLGFDGTITYSVWEKQAVRIMLTGGKLPVNIGTRRPQELLAALQGGQAEQRP